MAVLTTCNTRCLCEPADRAPACSVRRNRRDAHVPHLTGEYLDAGRGSASFQCCMFACESSIVSSCKRHRCHRRWGNCTCVHVFVAHVARLRRGGRRLQHGAFDFPTCMHMGSSDGRDLPLFRTALPQRVEIHIQASNQVQHNSYSTEDRFRYLFW